MIRECEYKCKNVEYLERNMHEQMNVFGVNEKEVLFVLNWQVSAKYLHLRYV